MDILLHAAQTQEALKDIAEAAVSGISLDELYRKVHHSLGKVLPAKNFYIALLNQAADGITVPYSVDEISFIPKSRPIGKGLTEYVMRMGHSVHLTAADFERLWEAGEVNLWFVQINEWLGAPLKKSTGEVFGMISICSIGDTPPYNPGSAEMMTIIAAQVAMVIESKGMEQELRQHAGRLEETVERRTQELYASNQELTAMNEQIRAMNDCLHHTNQELASEIEIRRRTEEELTFREKQYQATMSLMTDSDMLMPDILRSVMSNATNLVNCPLGINGFFNEDGSKFVVHHMSENGVVKDSAGFVIKAGTILTEQVFFLGTSVFEIDYRNRINRHPDAHFDRFTSIIFAPLKIQGKTVGALILVWLDEVHGEAEKYIEVVTQYANLVSIALERRDVQSRIERKNQLLQSLAVTTASLMEELELDAVLQSILATAMELAGVPHGFVLMIGEKDDHEVLFRAGHGRYADKVGKREIWQGGAFEEVLRTGHMVVVEDYVNWPLHNLESIQNGVTMSIHAPLKVDGRIIGDIGLTAYGETVTMNPEKIAAFEQFAAVASIAVKNALYHERFRNLAYHDILTGLPNRASLSACLEKEMEMARQGNAAGAVMFIDLDDLKVVNDNYGHSYGDAVIITAGLHIVESMGPETVVARIGGDEFIVVLTGEQSREKVAALAEKLVKLLSQDYEVSDEHIHLSASLGVAFYPEDGDNAEDILKNADSAMYVAKNAGKNCWRFYAAHIGEESYVRMMLTNSLHRALEKKELSLHFQPQISCDNRRIVAFEALLRWNSPEHGSVPPSRFIPLAEKSGLICPIGQYVLAAACHFLARLNMLGFLNLRVAVNISPRQLAEEDFVESVNRCIIDAGIAPSQLELEVTENVFIESMEDSINKLLILKRMGVKLALDDFGTGYSSLTYLRHLPLHTLKIDKAFIDPIPGDGSQERFVRFIIEMAHSLKLQVVAEGVEKKTQVTRLEKFFCDIIQGYVFSRPVPEEEAIRLLCEGNYLRKTRAAKNSVPSNCKL